MRFGFDLCSDEMAFLCKRKKYVASAMKNVFHLQQDLQDHEVCWGGGEGGRRGVCIAIAFVFLSR